MPDTQVLAVKTTEPTKEDEIYRENVMRLMAEKSPELISNGQLQHAAALFECFFKSAVRDVKILCKSLRREVFDQPRVIAEFLGAAGRGVVVRILVQDKVEEGSEFKRLFQELERQNGDLTLSLREGVAKKDQMFAVHQNFAVMDAQAFRFEMDHDGCKAVASMNDPASAGPLSFIFDRLLAVANAPQP